MATPYDQQLATFTQLPADHYPPPGPPGSYDAELFADWAYPVGGRTHAGDDVGGNPGTPIRAIAHGSVRYAAVRGSPAQQNWGWVVVLEHTFRSGQRLCSVYGHCAPRTGLQLGDFVPIGEVIASIADYTGSTPNWGNHLHFGVYDGPFGAPLGSYPSWLVGYLPPTLFPGRYLDPYAFVRRFQAAPASDQVPGPGAARPITSNAPLEGQGIEHPDDEDWFSFNGQAGRRISLAVTRESSLLTPQLALFTSANGVTPTAKVAGADVAASLPYFSAASWRVALTDFPLPTSGRYLIKLRGAGQTTGRYRFTKAF